MKRLTRIIAILSLVVAVSAPGSSVGPGGAVASTLLGDCTPDSGWPAQRADLAAQTVQLVNQHRASLGLGALSSSPALDASAVWKARHMAQYGYMSHNDPAPPVARSTADRMSACGVTGSWGENIAYGYATAQAVVTGWLNSPGHRANIERASFTAIGSGAAVSASGRVYWAHTFSSTGGSAPPPPPPPPPPPAPTPTPTPPPPTPTPTPTPPPTTPAPPPKGQPAPTPPPPGTPPTPAPVAIAGSSAAAGSVTLSNLKLTPSKPRAGRILASTVTALKRGSRLRSGHVFCSARFQGRALKVVTHRLKRGQARCAWRIPPSARGKVVSASVVVQQGRLRAHAPFRAVVSP